jgi:hypothetical protein
MLALSRDLPVFKSSVQDVQSGRRAVRLESGLGGHCAASRRDGGGLLKFRKKPVVIEAEQFLGADPRESSIYPILRVFLGQEFAVSWTADQVPYIVIHTLEGQMRADVGDWIIKGVKGEFYSCKPDIFRATYEAVYGAT